MTYRLIDNATEWDRLLPLFELVGRADRLPSPQLATAAIAESESGEIAACLILQPALHAEPIIVDPKYRKAVRFTRLFEEFNKRACPGAEYYCFTVDDLTAGMARMAGLRELPWRIFVKEF